MTLEEFDRLQHIAEDDTKLPDTLREIMVTNNLLPSTIQKWTKLFIKQKFIVSQLKVDLNQIYGEKFKYYKFDDNYSWSSTKEIESQINKDSVYIAATKNYETQKYILDFIDETLVNIKNLGFTIKNYLDYQKMIYVTGTGS